MMNTMWKTWCGSVALCAMLAMLAMGCGNIEDEDPGATQGALSGDRLSDEAREPGCLCPTVYDPVCGVDGETYGNACEARCAGVRVEHPGECREEGCYCPAVWDPVCGVDGETYGNSCEAGCADVEVDYEGECREEGCLCPTVWDPVCGVDGETYGNACEARCAGVRVAHQGECRDTTPEPECRSARDCKVGGCSGQLCGSVNDDLISTCEYLPEYACYDQKYTSCGCFDGQCGWDQTEELESCIEEAGSGRLEL